MPEACLQPAVRRHHKFALQTSSYHLLLLDLTVSCSVSSHQVHQGTRSVYVKVITIHAKNSKLYAVGRISREALDRPMVEHAQLCHAEEDKQQTWCT